MGRLHLSRETYTAGWGEFCHNWAHPDPDGLARSLCGKEGPVLLRGRGAGLVPAAAIGGDAHCPTCAALARKGE